MGLALISLVYYYYPYSRNLIISVQFTLGVWEIQVESQLVKGKQHSETIVADTLKVIDDKHLKLFGLDGPKGLFQPE